LTMIRSFDRVHSGCRAALQREFSAEMRRVSV
jgi:hypothetical protein